MWCSIFKKIFKFMVRSMYDRIRSFAISKSRGNWWNFRKSKASIQVYPLNEITSQFSLFKTIKSNWQKCKGCSKCICLFIYVCYVTGKQRLKSWMLAAQWLILLACTMRNISRRLLTPIWSGLKAVQVLCGRDWKIECPLSYQPDVLLLHNPELILCLT